MSADYSFNAVPLFGWQWLDGQDAQAIVALGVCLAAVALAIRCYRHSKAVFFFVALFLITLAPVANLFVLIGTIMAERLLYLPSIGVAGSVVVGALVVLLVAACAIRTFARNFDWFDDLSLGRSAVRACPGSFKAHFLLASSLLDRGPSRLAIHELDRTLASVDGLPDDRGSVRTYEVAAADYRMKGIA